MQTMLILLPIDLAGELEREAVDRGVLVAELAGLILHAAWLTRCDSGSLQVEQVNDLGQVNHD